MKCLFIILLFILLAFNSVSLYAHSGGTDSKGGHHDRRRGGYHYHHGMGPHQHTNGECPYSNSSTMESVWAYGKYIVGFYFV